MSIEQWKDIKGYEGFYQVSNLGNVKNIKRNTIRKLKEDNSGYLHCLLSANAVRKTFLVHRLVAAAFIDNPENKPFINHINANRSDNCVENLEWCTQKENINHSRKMGNQFHSTLKGEKHHNTQISDERVTLMRKARQLGMTHKDIAMLVGISVSYTTMILTNKKR
jgi:hypothetical protein